MTTRPAHAILLPIALLAGAALLSACSPDPQEKYEQATEALKEAREARNDAQDKLDAKKEELAERRSKLNEAEAKLTEARKKVEEASQAVNETVNDEVLFRSIQRELLDKKHFKDAAISVGVKNRVVTLTGNVPNDKTRKQALEIAKSQAGVERVVDRMRVGEPQDDKSGQGAEDDKNKNEE